MVLLALGGFALNPALALESVVVDGCLVCHKGELGLTGQPAEDLAATIEAMMSGSRAHIVPIAELSDADLRELAEILAGGGDQ
jgi:cytochrome c553